MPKWRREDKGKGARAPQGVRRPVDGAAPNAIHYFQWADQPCTGRFDGESDEIGLVDVTDRPISIS
jgi:hypothetical protein